jgi:hypothetical protein
MKMHLGLRVAQCQLSSWYGVLGELLAIAGAPGVVRSGVAAVLAEGICLLFVSWGVLALILLLELLCWFVIARSYPPQNNCAKISAPVFKEPPYSPHYPFAVWGR